jgi:hypothetical protein
VKQVLCLVALNLGVSLWADTSYRCTQKYNAFNDPAEIKVYGGSKGEYILDVEFQDNQTVNVNLKATDPLSEQRLYQGRLTEPKRVETKRRKRTPPQPDSLHYETFTGSDAVEEETIRLSVPRQDINVNTPEKSDLIYFWAEVTGSPEETPLTYKMHCESIKKEERTLRTLPQ